MLNSISNQTNYDLANSYKSSSSNSLAKNSENSSDAEDSGVVYTNSNSDSDSNSNVELKNPYDDLKNSLNRTMEKSELIMKNFEILFSNILKKQSNYSFLSSSNSNTNADAIQKAKEAISEDGYYGVNQTSERILNFAKAIAGDDQEKLAKMRDAVEKGFAKAEKMWGGELPEICQQTYKKVMDTFDEWQNPAN